MGLRVLFLALCGIQAVYSAFDMARCDACCTCEVGKEGYEEGDPCTSTTPGAECELPSALTNMDKTLPDLPLCAASGKVPKVPKHALKFCHIFPDKSCCIPAQDAEIEEHYFTLLDAGDICAKESSMAKDALKMIFCAACSPNQPDYIDKDDGSFKICSNLAKKVKPDEFDECGMVMVAERGDLCGGDDVIVPGDIWPTEEVEGWEEGDVWPYDCCHLEECPAPAPPAAQPQYGKPAASGFQHAGFSCQGYWKFINAPNGAYPPFLDGGATTYIQVVECKEETSTVPCNTKCFTGGASSAVTHAAILAVSLLAVLSTVWA